jgi:tetratricopeptide (TPR) repeat protein
MVLRENEQERAIKDKTQEAIALAMQGKWESAAALNRELLDADESDLGACNRLGKALLQLGDGEGAKHAFSRSLELSPSSAIARKNIELLLASGGPRKTGGTQIAPHLLIGDSGKSARVALLGCAPESERPFVSPGAEVEVERSGDTLAVNDQTGQLIGIVPPKLGRRLVPLMEGGNQYKGVVFTTTVDTVKIILRESYQHPSQRSKLSFLMNATAEPEPVAEALLR